MSEPRTFSKFNDLSVAIAFAITGLVLVYLPDILNKSIDWKVEGRALGIVLAIIGAAFILMAASKLTDREGFTDWGMATLVGALTIGLIIILSKYRLPSAVAIMLIALIALFVLIVVYALVSGFASFFDEPSKPTHNPRSISAEDEALEPIATGTHKRLNWYERITLLVAVMSTIATIVAAVEPIVHG